MNEQCTTGDPQENPEAMPKNIREQHPAARAPHLPTTDARWRLQTNRPKGQKKETCFNTPLLPQAPHRLTTKLSFTFALFVLVATLPSTWPRAFAARGAQQL